ncbi:ATP-binding cassette domain-containing protein [Streptomyces albipurpureus]|uniref:ABC transporter ATP-binding protein/permease n=1 Tax=Streptomyces albipurpureus TaxID=2897419 RepID=A0ABT0UXC9_9ACTN|nr:ABC transporter ATP-binding protein [Streptomyces sp. CWNU-1]MCM2392765.1 ABC transporter ATP-binding protein/permease [Streptomyces sp. CWNU-1]
MTPTPPTTSPPRLDPLGKPPEQKSTTEGGALRRVTREGVPFLRARSRAVLRLAGWSLLEFAQTFLTGYAVAQAIDRGFLSGSPTTGLLWLAVAAIATFPAALATRRVFGGLADLVEPLRDGLVRRSVSRALAQALTAPTPATTRSVSQVTHQSEIARDGWAGLVLSLRAFVFTAAGALAGLAALSPRLLLVVLPPLLLGLGLFLATLIPMAARQRAYLGADEAFAAHAGHTASALRDIAATGAGQRTLAGARDLASEQAGAARSLARWAAVRIIALAVCSRLPPLLLLLAAPWLMRHGLTSGALVGAFTYLTQALAPALHALLSVLGTAGGRLVVVLDRFTGRVQLPPAPTADSPPPHSPLAAVAELRAVSFAYGPAARPVLDRLDLTLRPGEHLAVVGPSGSGKSTLAAVLAAVMPPTEGEVRWLGRPTGDAEHTAVRTLLPQQAHVFTGTLRENVCYLRPDADEQEILASVAAMGVQPLMERLGGLDAPVDPQRLSLGERQLIALCRAHLTTAPLLILDEATSHLDPAAEAQAENALAARGGTLVVIAHRLSSAARAQRVLVMDGTHTACGTPAELLAHSELYRDLTGHWSPAPAGPPSTESSTEAPTGLPVGTAPAKTPRT